MPLLNPFEAIKSKGPNVRIRKLQVFANTTFGQCGHDEFGAAR